MTETTTRPRPLILRPGAHFDCAGDGLCCSDVHALGPVSRADVERLLPTERLTRRVAELGARSMQTRGGRCVMLEESGCAAYERRPNACRRFPFRLVATPLGGRVVTEHRCPCRTMGERSPLTREVAIEALRVGGRLDVDARVAGPIEWSTSRSMKFAEYVAWESALLARLDAGEEPPAVFDAAPFPALDALSWQDVGHLWRSRIDGSALGEALAMAGDVLLMELGALPSRPLRARPWAWAFERAEARSSPGSPRAMMNDYLADALFGLDWVPSTNVVGALGALQTQATLLEAIAGRVEATGARADRAMAEAICVIELAFASSVGQAAMAAIKA